MLDEVRRYELYVIFQPELEEPQLEELIARTDGYLTSNGGDIIEVVRKGKRRLEYPIQRNTQGIDVIYQVFLPASSLETLERQLNLNENVLRYLIVRRDDLEDAERLVATAEEIEAEVSSLIAEPIEPSVAETEAEPAVIEATDEAPVIESTEESLAEAVVATDDTSESEEDEAPAVESPVETAEADDEDEAPAVESPVDNEESNEEPEADEADEALPVESPVDSEEEA